MRASHVRRGLFATFAILASTQWSMALDANDFATKLTDAYLRGGAALVYDSATVAGDSVTLSNVAMEVDGTPFRFDLGNLVFDGVTENGSGGYTVASLNKDKLSFAMDEVAVTITDIVMEDLQVPAESAVRMADEAIFANRFATGPIAVSFDGRDVVKIARTESVTDKSSDGSRFDMSARADGFEVDLSDVGDPRLQQTINGMGYQYLNGDIVAKGSWLPESGEISLTEYAYTLNDVGRLDMQLSISGYTLDFINKLQQLQQQIDGAADDAQSQQATGLAMMGLMQGLTFNGMSMRFDDASVTNKLLEMAGSRQGMSRDQMVQSLQVMVPLALVRLQNADFQKMVTEAVSLYLDDPKNIEIAAQPDKPLSFAAIAGSAMAAPQTLPDLLNVTVTANQ